MDSNRKTVLDILKANLPGASDKILLALEEEIKAMYEDQQGFRMQWRTKLIEVINPEDAEKPKDQQRVLFRFEARAGDFADPRIEFRDFSFSYRISQEGATA